MTTDDGRLAKLYDRFDLLFYVTIVTVALLLLVDLEQDEGLAEVLSLTVTFLTATLLILAVAAAGVGRRGAPTGNRRRRHRGHRGRGSSAVRQFACWSRRGRVACAGGRCPGHRAAAPDAASRRHLRDDPRRGQHLLCLLAIAAAYLFLFIDTTLSGADLFFGEQQPTTVFMYFSLVTVTSLGYGDFYPAGVFGRAAAAWESVIGQIYLVVVVARLVSLYSGGRLFPGRNDPPAAD